MITNTLRASVSLAIPPSIAPGVNDPTKTLMLRRQFSAQMTKRFRELKGKISKYIIDNNGLSGTSGISSTLFLSNETYTDPNGVRERFMRWLEQQENITILGQRSSILTPPEPLPPPPEQLRRQPVWTDTYVAAAYRRGTKDSAEKLNKELMSLGATPAQNSILSAVLKQMSQGWFAERFDALALYMTDVFSELSGITVAMNQRILTLLTTGLLSGRTPTEIARSINRAVDMIGIVRARRLARTSASNVYNGASINGYQSLTGYIDGRIIGEYLTAGDSLVRQRHAARSGKLYELDVIRGLFGEWNCRCTFSPFIVEEGEKIPKSRYGPIN